MKSRRNTGFTLIELLVVIAIIGILASVVLASLSSARAKGRDAARISSIKSLKTALELYYDDNGGYPTSDTSDNGDVGVGDTKIISALVPKYIPSIPQILIDDGDHYYALGYRTGVAPGYDMLIYGENFSRCRSGTVPGNNGDWGESNLCNF